MHGALHERGPIGDRGLQLLNLLGGTAGDDLAVREWFDADKIRVGVEAGPLDERPLPIPEE